MVQTSSRSLATMHRCSRPGAAHPTLEGSPRGAEGEDVKAAMQSAPYRRRAWELGRSGATAVACHIISHFLLLAPPRACKASELHLRGGRRGAAAGELRRQQRGRDLFQLDSGSFRLLLAVQGPLSQWPLRCQQQPRRSDLWLWVAWYWNEWVDLVANVSFVEHQHESCLPSFVVLQRWHLGRRPDDPDISENPCVMVYLFPTAYAL